MQRQIDLTDGQINALVYELYGLTPEEIALVEGSAETTNALMKEKADENS